MVPSTHPGEGMLLAENIRKAVAQQAFIWNQQNIYLTVSIGLGNGSIGPHSLTDVFNKLMVEADECLYRSKKEGRNRTSARHTGSAVFTESDLA